MKQLQFICIFLFLGIGLIGIFSCQKKGDYINESQVGNGMHYYPVVLNKSFTDTISHKKLKDLKFTANQKVIFQLQYRSKDSLSQVELWERQGKDSQMVKHIDYSTSFYSDLKQCDTTFLSYQLSAQIDTTLSSFYLIPKVKTKKGLEAGSRIKIALK